MRKGSGKDIVVVLDGYTMKEITRFPSTALASMDLGIKPGTIRQAISNRSLAYECYFVYLSNLEDFKPKRRAWRTLNGIKHSEKLDRLRKAIEY